jgi:hypothetical protein
MARVDGDDESQAGLQRGVGAEGMMALGPLIETLLIAGTFD